MIAEIKKKAYARAGLIGNPSDGYNGKTIALSVKNFSTEVVMRQSEDIQFVATAMDESRYESIQALHRDISMHGYYGGIRLVKGAVKVFVDYCLRTGKSLRDDNFTISYSSDIPQQVGMAGSSAIIVATLRALMEFYAVDIEKQLQPSLVLSVEQDELGIGGGLQDRVIQVYEGVVAMDFSKTSMIDIDGYQAGLYTQLDPSLLPPLYLAYRPASSEPTEVFHNNLRERYDAGDSVVIDSMNEFALLTDRALEALHSRDSQALASLLNRNFDVRNAMCELNSLHTEMVTVARSVGVSAKYAGSGGAIIGSYNDQAQYEDLVVAMQGIGCEVIQPVL